MQVDDLTAQQQDQQQLHQQALAVLKASVEEEVQAQRPLLQQQALAALETEVAASLQVCFCSRQPPVYQAIYGPNQAGDSFSLLNAHSRAL